MGRLNSKRKLKQCDPFYKGKKSETSKVYNLCPKVKRSKKGKMNQASIDRFVLDGCVLNNSKPLKTMGMFEKKLDSESFKSFNRRIGKETKRIIQAEGKKCLNTTKKRNEYFDKKKMKLKRKKMTPQERYEMDYQQSGNTEDFDMESALAKMEHIPFGARVDAPPKLPKLKRVNKN